MAGAAFVDAIGLLSGAFGIIQFSQGLFAGGQEQGATINIKAALAPRDQPSSTGGGIDHTYAFSSDNQYNGQSDGCGIDGGGVCTLTVAQQTPGIRAGFVSVANGNDATCIAWITVTQYDGTFGGAWTGDIGYNCGQDWYENTEPAGKNPDDTVYVPKCTWLDGDHTDDIANAALKFNTVAYGEAVQDTINKDVCASTIYGPDNGPISGQPAKRDTRKRPQWIIEQLIVSNHTSHSAENLCSSATSWGPDFVDAHGNFCDMGSKTLIPLCSSKNVEGCVEVDEAANTVVKRASIARRAVNVVHKSYKTVSKWSL